MARVQAIVPRGAMPKAQPYEVAVMVGENLVGIFGYALFFVHHPAILHLVDVRQVSAKIEGLGVGGPGLETERKSEG